jgi:crotonobetainyl-CoA:carnitine CoA-transferase CaiB-like acyl-CoA transferase
VTGGILDGVRVADFSMGWAGPLLTQCLADHGADVIKVESCTRTDWWRNSRALFADGPEQLECSWEQQPLFNAVNEGKRGITLDLASAEGNRLARALVATVDLVVENYTPRVMGNLGLGWDVLSGERPGLIMVSLPAFGSTGPWSAYKATAFVTESLAGVSSRCGYAYEGPMLLSGSPADPNSGVIGALSVALALRHRRRTGEGQHIEVSQVEALMPHVGAELLGVAATGVVPPRTGNARAHGGPRGVYPVRGEDRWIAVDADTDARWAALASLLGLDEPAWNSPAARAADHARLDERVATWTRERDGAEAVAALQAAGVPAAPVQNAADVLDDPHVVATGLFHTSERAHVGEKPYPGPVLRMSRSTLTPRTPAPTLGEHNAEVLGGLLGLDDAELAALADQGVIGTRPVGT